MTVQAQVRYLKDEWRGRRDMPSIGDRETRRANTAKHAVAIHDARPRLAAGDIDLDVNGFALLRHCPQVGNFQDAAEVQSIYYPEIEALVKRHTGAVAVFVTQHLVRTEDTRDFNKAYARFLHCDYSLDGARAAAERVLAKRGLAPADYANNDFAWYNAWQPFDHPALCNPLALVDAASVPPEDLVDYRYTGYANARRTAAAAGAGNAGPATGEEAEAAMAGKSSMPARNPAHRFYYVPNMAPDELLFFKQLDTRRRGGACPHTSFDDPTSPPDAPPRRSIETRLMAVFAPAA